MATQATDEEHTALSPADLSAAGKTDDKDKGNGQDEGGDEAGTDTGTEDADMPGDEPDANDHGSSGHGHSFIASTALQNDEKYGIHEKHWFLRKLRGYVRQDWDTINVPDGVDELRATWVELFFDLIYVACIIHLSAEAADSLSNKTTSGSYRRLADDYAAAATSSDSGACGASAGYEFIFVAFAQFGLLMNAWFNAVMYITHFVMNQMIDDAIRVLFMTGILSMGIFIKENDKYMRAFLISYSMLQVIQMIMYAKVYLIPRAKNHALLEMFGHLVTFVLATIIVSVLGDDCKPDYIRVYLAVYVILYCWENFQRLFVILFSYLCKDNMKYTIGIPINVPHLSERVGLFAMIILGESIISVMTSELGELDLNDSVFEWKTDGSPPSQILIVFMVLTFVLSYMIAVLYFDCQPLEESILDGDKNHALRISAPRGFTYLLAHRMLFFGLLGFGMGIKITGKHLLGSEKNAIDVLLPGYSLIVIIVSLQIIRVAHPFTFRRKVWIFRVLLMLGMIVAASLWKTLNHGVIFVIFFISVALLVLVDVEGREIRNQVKEEMKERRQAAHESSEQITEDKAHVMPSMKRYKSAVGMM